jgi:hypothetical protein
MEQIQGMVDSIHTKTVTTKFGDKAVYIATVNGQEVNLGFKTTLAQGQNVTLPVEHKYGSYQLIQGNGAGTTSSPVANTTPTKLSPAPRATAFPTPQGTKDISIIRQNSLTHATNVVETMTHQDLFNPTTEREYRDKVLEVAYEYQDFSTGWREVKMAEEQGE